MTDLYTTLSDLRERLDAYAQGAEFVTPDEWQALKQDIETLCATLETSAPDIARATLPDLAQMISLAERALAQSAHKQNRGA